MAATNKTKPVKKALIEVKARDYHRLTSIKHAYCVDEKAKTEYALCKPDVLVEYIPAKNTGFTSLFRGKPCKRCNERLIIAKMNLPGQLRILSGHGEEIRTEG